MVSIKYDVIVMSNKISVTFFGQIKSLDFISVTGKLVTCFDNQMKSSRSFFLMADDRSQDDEKGPLFDVTLYSQKLAKCLASK